jgi:ABC-type sugar transport system substrate-binding protein
LAITRRQRRGQFLVAAGATALLALTACGSDVETDDSTDAEVEDTGDDSVEDDESVEDTGADEGAAGEDIEIGFVVHFRGIPFIQQIIDGAEQAGEDLGITVRVAGPPDFDADAQLRDVEGLVNAGVDGVVTSIPGTSMSPSMTEIVERGIPVATFNLPDPTIPAPYVGQRDTESGRIIGRRVAGEISDGAKVIITNCGPGLELLDNRAKGVSEGLLEADPSIEVVGPVAISGDQAQNTQDWEQLVAANPDAEGLVGVCAPDLTSLGLVNAANDGRFVAAGYDLTEANLAAIEEGNAFMTMGQNPFVQGYLTIKMVYDALMAGEATPVGYIESGNEIVTAEGGEMPWGLGDISFEQVKEIGSDREAFISFYRPLLVDDGPLVDYEAALEPLEAYGQ